MKNILHLAVFCIITVNLSAASIYQCISTAFNGTCKTKLYACTNHHQCSYQLHENTRHIFLNQESQVFPTLYFSNQLARNLYECLKKECSLPSIDQNYPKTLPFDYCLMEVYDICRGNIEDIYQNPQQISTEANCYRKYCQFPKILTQ